MLHLYRQYLVTSDLRKTTHLLRTATLLFFLCRAFDHCTLKLHVTVMKSICVNCPLKCYVTDIKIHMSILYRALNAICIDCPCCSNSWVYLMKTNDCQQNLVCQKPLF